MTLWTLPASTPSIDLLLPIMRKVNSCLQVGLQNINIIAYVTLANVCSRGSCMKSLVKFTALSFSNTSPYLKSTSKNLLKHQYPYGCISLKSRILENAKNNKIQKNGKTKEMLKKFRTFSITNKFITFLKKVSFH